MITHKFREVMAFADEVTVLRRGRFAGSGKVADLTRADMAEMMIGAAARSPRAAARVAPTTSASRVLQIDRAERARRQRPAGGRGSGPDRAARARSSASPAFRATASASWSRCWPASARRHAGEILVDGERYGATRAEIKRHRLCLLPEEPLRNACVARDDRGREHGVPHLRRSAASRAAAGG